MKQFILLLILFGFIFGIDQAYSQNKKKQKGSVEDSMTTPAPPPGPARAPKRPSIKFEQTEQKETTNKGLSKEEKAMLVQWGNILKNPEKYSDTKVTWRLLVNSAPSQVKWTPRSPAKDQEELDDIYDRMSLSPGCSLLGQEDKYMTLYDKRGNRYNFRTGEGYLPKIRTGDWILATGYLKIIVNDKGGVYHRFYCTKIENEGD